MPRWLASLPGPRSSGDGAGEPFPRQDGGEAAIDGRPLETPHLDSQQRWHLGLRRLAALGLLLAVIALDLWGTWQLGRSAGAASDLFPRWYGARAWVLAGHNIYSPEVRAGIFAAMYGRPPRHGELDNFVFGFTYPPYVAVILLPLILLPLPVAQTVWLLFGQVSLVVSCWLLSRFPGAARAAGASRSIWRFRWLVLVALVWPPVLANIVFGQFAVVVLCLLVAVRSLLLKNRPLAAGVCLAATMVKPQLAVLVVPLVLVASASGGWLGCRRLWLGCGVGLAVLALGSFVVAPNWVAMFWQSVQRYNRVVGPVSAVGLLLRLSTPSAWATMLTPLLQAAVIVAAGGIAVRLAWQRHTRHTHALPPVATLIAPVAWVTVLAVPPLYEWNSVILLIPWAESLFAVEERLALAHRPFWPVVLLVLLLSAATVPLALAHPNESRVIWPMIVTVAWLATRRMASLASPPGPLDRPA